MCEAWKTVDKETGEELDDFRVVEKKWTREEQAEMEEWASLAFKALCLSKKDWIMSAHPILLAIFAKEILIDHAPTTPGRFKHFVLFASTSNCVVNVKKKCQIKILDKTYKTILLN